MNTEFIDTILTDCKVLLSRALIGKTVNAFGIDGFGQHGTNDQGLQFTVSSLAIVLGEIPEPTQIFNTELIGLVAIVLDGYDAGMYGHVATDGNLKISLNALLAAEHIDTTCWSWAPIEQQGLTCFVIVVDINSLIEW